MGVFGKITVTIIVVSCIYFYMKSDKVIKVPKLEEKWFGRGQPRQEDVSVKPFKIDIPDEVIKDLYTRLNNTMPFQPPLEEVNQNYGMNTKLLETIVNYWKNKYDWKKRQEFLNQFPQFQTNIQGLNIHFIHVKPKNVPKGTEIIPIMIIHGWPGSVREFYEMIPILITPREGQNFVFEVIAPSLPGYGFSEGAPKTGLGPGQIGQIFHKLMKRLKFQKYYLQGGDWGSAVSQTMAVMYPESIIGIHRNWCLTDLFENWKVYVGMVFPKMFFNQKEIERIYPLSKLLNFLILETGYFHLQASKPDTVGVALRESPAGLAAYILEKFTTGTNPEWQNLPDGGLTKKFTLDKLLDNIMIYWVTRSITTSIRLYSEACTKEYQKYNFRKIPIEIPAACNRFKNELLYSPEVLLRESHKNLIHLTDYEDGGHFAAFEMPELLGNDIIEFVKKVRNLRNNQHDKEL